MGAQPMPFPSDHPTNRLDHDPRTALRGPAYEWPLWSTTMRVVTADPHALPSARRLVETELAHVELAASRGRRDAEVSTLPTGRRTRISGTLAAILGAALRAAEATDGAVDPTTGRSLRPGRRRRSLARDRARRGAPDRARTPRRRAGPRPHRPGLGRRPVCGRGRGRPRRRRAGQPRRGHRDRRSRGRRRLGGPRGRPRRPAERAGGPGRHPDRPGRGDLDLDVDRRPTPFRTATVVAPDCVTATTWSAAALADHGLAHLTERGLPARLVGVDGSLTYLGGWPEDGELAPTP